MSFRHRTLAKSAPESIQDSLHSFFEAAASDLETTVENLSATSVSLPQCRSQQAKGLAQVFSYTTSVLFPMLTSLFQHLGSHTYGVDLLGEREKTPTAFMFLLHFNIYIYLYTGSSQLARLLSKNEFISAVQFGKGSLYRRCTEIWEKFKIGLSE